MRIKTFEAPTMHEALILAKRELGDEAVVLNTKHVKSGGVLGIGGSGKVELTAAIDDALANASRPAFDQKDEAPQAVTAAIANAADAVQDSAVMGSFAAKLYADAGSSNTENNQELKQLREELKQLSTVVQSLLGNRTVEPTVNVASMPLLLRLGVDEGIAKGLLNDCLAIEDSAALAAALAAKLQAFTMPPTLDDREVIAVVGPTGVGKTTTLAKIAAKFAIEQGKKVAMVTADTFRIGAVEQLRTYARIMGVPLEIALSPEEVADGVEKHRDKDIVLIDTVGRSQRSEDHLNELKSFVDAANPTSVHLVVAASLSREVQAEVVDRFKALSPTRLVITKLDETTNRGCLVNLPLSTGLGISCTTAGQNVPQDIEFANAGGIARLLMEVA